jgi:hypothetical protein
MIKRTDPNVNRSVYVPVFFLLGLALATVQRRIVSGHFVPAAVEVVGHDIDEIKVLTYLWHVVALFDALLGSGYRGAQK